MKHLENMPSASEPREKTARCAFYLSLLIKLAHQKIVTRKCEQNFGISVIEVVDSKYR